MAEPRPDGTGRPPASSPAARRKTLALVALALALAGAGGLLLATRVRPPPPAAPVAPAAPPKARPELRVLSVTGSVERAAAGGAWLKVGTGDVLLPDQQLRAGPGGRAELGADRARVVVADRTHVLVRELSDDVHRFQLSRGLVTVDYPAGVAQRVRIEAPTGDAIAESQGARFHVSANGLVFAVATATGKVDVTAAGTTVAVGAGQLSLVGRAGVPTPPRPIPTEVLLKIAAASTLSPGKCLDTTGRTDPASRATVDGEEVQVAEDGRFPIRVAAPRPDGVVVRVVASDGRELVRNLPCGKDPAARIRDLRMRWSRGDP